jgi:hypothetical protein
LRFKRGECSAISSEPGMKEMNKHWARSMASVLLRVVPGIPEKSTGPPLACCLDAKEVLDVIYTMLTGMRCRATKDIRSHQGLTRRFTEGTVQFHLDNLGRHLISVSWDNGVTDYAYPFEIESIDEEKPVASLEGAYM